MAGTRSPASVSFAPLSFVLFSARETRRRLSPATLLAFPLVRFDQSRPPPRARRSCFRASPGPNASLSFLPGNLSRFFLPRSHSTNSLSAVELAAVDRKQLAFPSRGRRARARSREAEPKNRCFPRRGEEGCLSRKSKPRFVFASRLSETFRAFSNLRGRPTTRRVSEEIEGTPERGGKESRPARTMINATSSGIRREVGGKSLLPVATPASRLFLFRRARVITARS